MREIKSDRLLSAMKAARRRYELIVFDWDGTLMDSAALIVSSIQRACGDLALSVPSEADARWIIGLGLDDALAHLLPELPRADYLKLAERYRFHFITRDHAVPLFEGVPSLLDELKAAGYLLAIATGKSRRGLARALAATGIERSFDATRCADECLPKPHPAMLLELMDELGTRRESTLMVGDTTHDLRMAANASVGSLAVAYGAHPKPDLLGCTPLGCLEDIRELGAWLQATS